MMATGVSLQLQFHEYGIPRKYRLSINRLKQNDDWKLHVASKTSRPLNGVSYRNNLHTCHCCLKTSFPDSVSALKSATLTLSRSYNTVKESPLVLQLAPAFGLIAFAIWGLGPVMRQIRKLFHKNDKDWVKSRTHYIFTSYFQPLLLWVGASLVCRALNPIVLTSSASQTIKQRILNFVQSFSTVVAVAFCLTSFIQQTQKYYEEKNNSDNARAMGFQFAGKAVYSLVWVAACCLFFELLGFSTHKWVTAGGLGTVLLTLAGREIFTNFLSSIMIHASRPFTPNDWIQAKFDGHEISGFVESVGWWSPTIIRGEDREAIYIPNHKFTVNILRNLTRKTHWRIKTHLAISHLDVNKINNIVADMRKVLSKNPQIEHKRLHRRVFLEEVNLENQALMILISCFVKTAHHEEYLCVKEAVLLDLLKVISHHKARLATPIRTVQKFYTDAVMDYDPFSKSVNRPLLLTDSINRINGEDNYRSKLRKSNEEHAPKTATSSKTQSTTAGSEGTTTQSNSKKQQNAKLDSSDHKTKSSKEMTTASESKPSIMPTEGITHNNSDNQQKTKVDSSGGKSEGSEEMIKPPMSTKFGGNEAAGTVTPESENTSSIPASTSKPVSVFEENIVLGVAINGTKKTLPVDVVTPSNTEPNEVAANRISPNAPNSTSKSNKDSKGLEGLGEVN